MTSAAFFLITRNIKNRIVRSVVRLRNPRYIAGALLAGFYFWSLLYRRGASRQFRTLQFGASNDFLIVLLSVLALVILIGAWALPDEAPGLVFSEAEIQFLFAGPVSRRQLLAYKTIRAQVQGVFSAVVFSFLVFRGSHLLGMWVAFVLLDVYMRFVSFVRARLRLAGIGWAWRALAVAVIAVAIGVVANRQLRDNIDVLADAMRTPRSAALARAITTIAETPPLGTVLYVPRAIARAVYAPNPLLPGLILLAVAAALFFATTQIDVAFEDASIVASQRALVRRARMRSGRFGRETTAIRRFPPPFQLAERGRPEVALVWKNLVGTVRMSAFPMIAFITPVFFAAAAAIFGKRHGIPDAVGFMGLMSTLLFVFIGPQAIRTDLRTDILRLDVVKTFPLSAETLLACELAAPLLTIALFELTTLLVSVTILQFGGHNLAFFTTPEFVVSAIVFIVPISTIQLLIQNGATILLPAWNTSTPSDSQRGFTAMGQRMLLLLGNLLTLALALLPAALLFFPSLWLTYKIVGHSPAGILVATIPAAAVLIIEIFIAHKFLAAQFEDIDIANDMDAAG